MNILPFVLFATSGIFLSHSEFWRLVAISYLSIMALLELYQVASYGANYFKDWMNCIDIIGYGLSIWFCAKHMEIGNAIYKSETFRSILIVALFTLGMRAIS